MNPKLNFFFEKPNRWQLELCLLRAMNLSGKGLND